MSDWIKLNHSLVRSAKIRLMARELKTKPLTALGLAVRWLVWLDEQTTDGQTNLTPEDVDDELGFRGGAAALCSIGWASLDADGCVVARDFEQHNGATAKRRALDARRQSMSRSRRDISHDASVTRVTDDALPEENRIENSIQGDSLCNALLPKKASPAPPLGFGEWVAALASAHPSLGKSRLLARDVEVAAREAFSRCPQAAGQAELLQAYLADSMQEDHNRVRFYRPVGQARFFADLEDVLAHAERWDRETGWSRRKTPRRRHEESTEEAVSHATEEDKEEFLRHLGRLKGGAK